jgi:predicted PurR-regulated permease PerM
MQMSRREQHVIFWAAVLAVLVAVLFLFRDILLPFVVGIGLAYALNPAVNRLQATGLPRPAAAMLLIAAALAVFAVALTLLAPLAAAQIKQLVAALPSEADRARAALEDWARVRLGASFPSVHVAIERAFSELQSGAANSAGLVLSGVLNRGMALVNVVSLLLVTPLVVFYLLVDWQKLVERVTTWLPRDHAGTILHLAEDINGAVGAFVRGQGLICMLLGAFYALGLSMVGLRYGLVVGLATGILAFVPVVGWAIGSLVAIGLALAQFGWAPASVLAVVAVMIAGQVADTAFLSPRIVGEKVGLHPVWLIFALLACSYLFGFVGTLVAVPLAAAVGVILRHGLKVYLDSDVYLGRSRGDP